MTKFHEVSSLVSLSWKILAFCWTKVSRETLLRGCLFSIIRLLKVDEIMEFEQLLLVLLGKMVKYYSDSRNWSLNPSGSFALLAIQMENFPTARRLFSRNDFFRRYFPLCLVSILYCIFLVAPFCPLYFHFLLSCFFVFIALISFHFFNEKFCIRLKKKKSIRKFFGQIIIQTFGYIGSYWFI